MIAQNIEHILLQLVTYVGLGLMAAVATAAILMGFRLKDAKITQGLSRLLDAPDMWNAFLAHGLIQSLKSISGGHLPADVPPATCATALLGCFDRTNPPSTWAALDAAIRQLPDCSIRSTLLSFALLADGDHRRLVAAVSTWFGHCLHRLEMEYRRTRVWPVLVLMVAVLALIANLPGDPSPKTPPEPAAKVVLSQGVGDYDFPYGRPKTFSGPAAEKPSPAETVSSGGGGITAILPGFQAWKNWVITILLSTPAACFWFHGLERLARMSHSRTGKKQ